MDINPGRTDGLPVFPHKKHYDMNGKIMVGAIISLSLVILIVLILHIYARCAVRSQARRRRRGATIHHLSLYPTHQAQLAASQPKTGLDPAVIASLPHFIVKDHLQDGDPTGGECAVCLSFLEVEEAARILPNCKHTFHVECIDRWLTTQSTCPICRTQVAPWPCPAPPADGAASAEGDGVSDGSSKEGGSSSRLSSFRRMIGRDWSSSRRIHVQPLEEQEPVQDLESQ